MSGAEIVQLPVDACGMSSPTSADFVGPSPATERVEGELVAQESPMELPGDALGHVDSPDFGHGRTDALRNESPADFVHTRPEDGRMNAKHTLSAHDRRRLCVAAPCDDTTAIRIYRGLPVRAMSRLRIERAARRLRLPLPPPEPRRGQAPSSLSTSSSPEDRASEG